MSKRGPGKNSKRWAVRLIEESVREFEDSQFVKMDRPCPTTDCDGEIWMLPNGRKCGCDTCKSVFSIERLGVSC